MAKFLRQLSPLLLLLSSCPLVRAQAARFDLAGPKVDVRVTRAGKTLPIAYVPNLQSGDKLWLHPDLPPTQSVHYLLIVAFLMGLWATLVAADILHTGTYGVLLAGAIAAYILAELWPQLAAVYRRHTGQPARSNP